MREMTDPDRRSHYPVRGLLAFSEEVFGKVGLNASDSEAAARRIIEADMRGIHSHGLIFLPRYARGVLAGHINGHPAVRVTRRIGAMAAMDGDNGLGHVVATRAMEFAIREARSTGASLVSVGNSNHYGAGACYVQLAVDAGLAAFITTNGPPVMAPAGGKSILLSNNPLAWGLPGGDGPAVIFDMACSTGARARVREAARRGESVPPYWAVDAEGYPTTNPFDALAGAMLPVGGHKGYGLAIVNEVLAGVLSGSAISPEVRSGVVQAGKEIVQDSWRIGHFVMAFDIEGFLPKPEYNATINRLRAHIHGADPAPGSAGVRLPGEQSHRRYQEAMERGVPLESETVQGLDALAFDLGCSPLADRVGEEGLDR